MTLTLSVDHRHMVTLYPTSFFTINYINVNSLQVTFKDEYKTDFAKCQLEKEGYEVIFYSDDKCKISIRPLSDIQISCSEN